jgi:nitrite reductase/ring-hydroxylating ferredoxin subunit
VAWTDLASAPAAGTDVCARDAVRGAVALEVATERGRFPLIVVETAAGLRGYLNACPHQFLPLDWRGGSLLSADGTRLMCSNHGATFDAATGCGRQGFAGCLDAVPLAEQAGRVVIGAEA